MRPSVASGPVKRRRSELARHMEKAHRCPRKIDLRDGRVLTIGWLDYDRWLSDEPGPRDLLRPFPADLMRMWPISTRVNKPENDDPTIVEPVQLTGDAA